MVAPISRGQTQNYLGVNDDMSLQLFGHGTKMDADASDDDGLDAAFDSFLSTEDTTFRTSLNLTPATTLGKRTRQVSQTQSAPDAKRFTFEFKTSTSSATRKFPFFGLPRELRDMAYDFALDNENVACRLPHQRYEGFREQNVYFEIIAAYGQHGLQVTTALPAWTTCSPEIRQEALEQFYSKVEFHIRPEFRQYNSGMASFRFDYDIGGAYTTTPIVQSEAIPRLQYATRIVLHSHAQALEYPEPCEACGIKPASGNTLEVLNALRKQRCKLTALVLSVILSTRPHFVTMLQGIGSTSPSCYWCGILEAIPVGLSRFRLEVNPGGSKYGSDELSLPLEKRITSHERRSFSGDGSDVSMKYEEIVESSAFGRSDDQGWACEATSKAQQRRQMRD